MLIQQLSSERHLQSQSVKKGKQLVILQEEDRAFWSLKVHDAFISCSSQLNSAFDLAAQQNPFSCCNEALELQNHQLSSERVNHEKQLACHQMFVLVELCL